MEWTPTSHKRFRTSRKDSAMDVAAEPFTPSFASPSAIGVSPTAWKVDAAPFTPGDYNPYRATTAPEYRQAMDSIYGLPFGGSLSFIGQGTNGDGPIAPCSVCLPVGSGKAIIRREISDQPRLFAQVTSAGFLDGDVSTIQINGKDYSPNKKGINLLVLDPKTFDAYVGTFDTHTHSGNESEHITKFLESIPDSSILILSTRYDAVRRLTVQGREALRRRGISFPAADDASELKRVLHRLDKSRSYDLLSICASNNAHKCAKLLLEAGWDVNHQKSHGSHNTALLDAIFHGSFDVARLLLEHGADTSVKNKWQETALDMAQKLYGVETLDELAHQ